MNSSTRENDRSFLPIRFGIRGFLILLVGSGIGVAAGIIVVVDYVIQKRTVVAYTRGALEMLVGTGSHLIRGEDIRQLNRKEDFRKPAYRHVYRALKQIYVTNYAQGLRENTIYVLKPSATGEHMIFAAHLPGRANAPYHLGSPDSMADEKVNYIGDSYPYSELMKNLMRGKSRTASTDIYTDRHGVWVSAYAPILDAAGNRIALLEADYSLMEINRRIFEQLLLRFAVIGGTALLSIGFIVFFSRRITGPIRRITSAFDRIAEGDFQVRLQLKQRDELGSLFSHFNRMARLLQERARLSRYVSSETIRQVETEEDAIVANRRAGERTLLCVLFSDIRGFTAFAADRPEEDVVSILNEALEIQTEAIVRNGGSVDKFVGDEVMATFSGDEMMIHAARAALEIHHDLKPLALRQDIAVGIGIHAGPVIRGDIGSRNRLDYTVIGNTVNMASRLCSQARRGQTLVTEEVHQKVSRVMETEYLGRGKFKGIKEPLRVYNIKMVEDR